MRSINHRFNKILAAVLLLFGLLTSVSANKYAAPPLELPFIIKNVGTLNTFEVSISEGANYSVALLFCLIPTSKWTRLFGSSPTSEESRRFNELLGVAKKTPSGEWIESGVPASFRVKILNDDNNEIIVDKLINNPGTRAHAYGRIADLVKQELPAGIYSIRVEYLSGSSELVPLNVKVLFSKTHHGK